MGHPDAGRQVEDDLSGLTRDQLIARLNSATNLTGSSQVDKSCPALDRGECDIADRHIRELALFPDENPNPVLRASNLGLLLYANAAARQLLTSLGLPPPGQLMIEPFLTGIQDSARSGECRNMELDSPCGRGYSFTLVPIAGANYVNVYGYDITRQKQTENSLRVSQERLALLASATVDGVVVSENDRIVDCNQQFANIVGLPASTLRGMTVAQLVAPEDIERAMEVVRSQSESNSEYTLLHADGSMIPVTVNGRPIGGDPGREQRLLLVRDLSGQRQRERKLHQLNRTLRAIQHSGRALLRAVDEQAYLMEVCRNVVEDCGHRMSWVGYTEDDHSIRPVAWAGHEAGYLSDARFGWADGEHGHGPAGYAIRTGMMSLCRDTRTDPGFKPWRALADERGYRSVITFPLLAGGRAFGIIAVYAEEPDSFSDQEIALLSELADDLSFGIQTIRLRLAHAQTEAALRISQADLNRAQAVGHIGSWRLDIRLNRLTWSTENHRIFGVPEGIPLTYQSFLSTVHPDDRDEVDRKWQEALNGGRFDIEHRVLLDSQVKWVRERAELEFDQAGVLLGGFGTSQDVTERKLAEEAVQRSETRYRLLVEQTMDGILVHDDQGGVLDINSAGARMFGYTREAFLDLNVSDLVMPEEASRLAHEMEQLGVGGVMRSELRARRKDGSSFFVEIVVLKLAGGRSQVVVRDITERKQSESRRLAELEKQRDALVREVHHRIKNHLQGVIALMRNRSEAKPELAAMLGEAISQIDTIAQVYGLQCKRDDSQVTLDNLIAIAISSATGATPIEYRPANDSRLPCLEANEVVPVVLVINELLTNAIKHTTVPHTTAPVHVSLMADNHCTTRIQIRNAPATLPAGFDFASGSCLGTGLELVRGLLPPQGAELTFRQESTAVIVELTLTTPVLFPARGIDRERGSLA